MSHMKVNEYLLCRFSPTSAGTSTFVSVFLQGGTLRGVQVMWIAYPTCHKYVTHGQQKLSN